MLNVHERLRRKGMEQILRKGRFWLHPEKVVAKYAERQGVGGFEEKTKSFSWAGKRIAYIRRSSRAVQLLETVMSVLFVMIF